MAVLPAAAWPPFRAGIQRVRAPEWFQQYHLRFTPLRLPDRLNLGVLLCPGHAHLQRTAVRAERAGGTEVAHVGDELVLVNQGAGIAYQDLASPALALLRVAGMVYTLDDDGLHAGHKPAP